MEIIKWKSIFQFSALQLYKSAVFLSLCRFFFFFCERGKLQLSNLLIMRKKRLFKTLLLFGLAALSLTTTAADKDKSYYPTKGYRGSFDVVWADNFKRLYQDEYRKSQSMSEKSYLVLQFSTTHGCQIMPELYAGIGAMIDGGGIMMGSRPEYNNDDFAYVTFTPFVTVRYDILRKRISPYLEGRVGYRCAAIHEECDYDKLYATPMIGVRFGNFNLAVSYECTTFGGEVKKSQTWDDTYYMTKRFSAIGFHAGFDFGARKKQ